MSSKRSSRVSTRTESKLGKKGSFYIKIIIVDMRTFAVSLRRFHLVENVRRESANLGYFTHTG